MEESVFFFIFFLGDTFMGWKNRLGRLVLAKNFLEDLKRELRLVVCRLRCFSPSNLFRIWRLRQTKNLQLNIGAGNHRVEGWVSIDLVFPDRGGIRWDVRWGLPFKAASVKKVHCEHFLEHLEYPEESLTLLRECRRVMALGGEMRVIVPDAGKYIYAYTKRDPNFWENLRDLGGSVVPFETEIEIINQAFRMGGEHRFAYDRKTLTRQLRQAGFTAVLPRGFSPDRYPDQTDAWRFRESLYLVAVNG